MAELAPSRFMCGRCECMNKGGVYRSSLARVVGSCIHLLDYLFMQYIRGRHRPTHDLHILIFIANNDTGKATRNSQLKGCTTDTCKRLYIYLRWCVCVCLCMCFDSIQVDFWLVGLWLLGASCEHFRAVPKSFCH